MCCMTHVRMLGPWLVNFADFWKLWYNFRNRGFLMMSNNGTKSHSMEIRVRLGWQDKHTATGCKRLGRSRLRELKC